MSDLTVDITSLDELDDAGSKIVTALAMEIRARYRDNAHTITGAMRQSASVIAPGFSDYDENVAAAAQLNPKATFEPEATLDDDGTAVVQVPINYAGFEEFGTVHQAAHPTLVPAVESVAADADEIVREVLGL